LYDAIVAGDGRVETQLKAERLIAARDADVLRRAVDLVALHVDLGAPPERILTELRRVADAAAAKAPGAAAACSRVLTIRVTAPTPEDAQRWIEAVRDLAVAEYGDSMRMETSIRADDGGERR